MNDPNALIAELTRATAGLRYPDAAGAPFEAFAWPALPGETARQAVTRNAPGLAPVAEQSVNAFFGPLADGDDAEPYQVLLNLLTRKLTGPTVVRAGTGRTSVYLIGRAGQQWAGVRTESANA